MNEEQIGELVNLAAEYLQAYDERMPSAGILERRGLWSSPPLAAEYSATLTFVQRLPVALERYSAKTIEDLVDDVLTAALQDGTTLQMQVRSLAAILNHDLLTRMYVPLRGVEMLIPEYDVGALQIVRMDDATFEERVIGPYTSMLQLNPRVNEESLRAQVETQRDRLRSLRGRACVEIVRSTDITKTQDFANATIPVLCDFLQFSSTLLIAHDKTLKISQASNVYHEWKHVFAISDGPGQRSISFAERASPGPMLRIDQVFIERVREWRVQRIADMVGRAPENEYDEMLQRSIRWFAKGEREDHPDDRKLSYITAIDLFFSHPGRGATARICKGFAFALGETEEALPWLARFMYHSFASRSETSHEGRLGVLADDELGTLRIYTRNAILSLLRHPMRSKRDIARWVNDRELALPGPIRTALRQATDRRRVEAERCMLEVASALTSLSRANVFDAVRANRAEATARVLRNGQRGGDPWIADVVPLAHRLRAANDAIYAHLDAGTESKRSAIIYINTVVRELGIIPWIREVVQ
ncbi:MAG: hypothetical protein WB681_10515 [Candidatus Cybelea sp.]